MAHEAHRARHRGEQQPVMVPIHVRSTTNMRYARAARRARVSMTRQATPRVRVRAGQCGFFRLFFFGTFGTSRGLGVFSISVDVVQRPDPVANGFEAFRQKTPLRDSSSCVFQ